MKLTIIELIKYIFLGALQGFTEPIPVSSSGHIFILKQILDTGILSDLNFEIIVNFGSLIAIIIVYWKDIKEIVVDFFKYLFKKEKTLYNEYKYAWLIMLGVIPIGIAGFLFKDTIENVLNNINVVGISFLVTAVFLFLVRNMKGKKQDKDITWKDALTIGIVQVIAVIPGISRSGSTLIAGMYRNLNRKAALKYSFMLYIPISIGTTILGVKDILEQSNFNEIILPYIIGFFVAMIVTYFTMKWFIDVVRKGKLIYFSIYCLILGILVLIFL